MGLVLPALLMLAVVHLAFLDHARTLAHFVVGGLAAVVAIEARGLATHTLPFLTPYTAGGRMKLAPFWFGLIIIGAQALGTLESAALASVGGTLRLIATLAVLTVALSWLNTRGELRGDELDAFQAQLDEATQLRL